MRRPPHSPTSIAILWPCFGPGYGLRQSDWTRAETQNANLEGVINRMALVLQPTDVLMSSFGSEFVAWNTSPQGAA